MGIMIDGVWHDADAGELQKSGQFVRSESSFRNWVTADGGPGPSGAGGFPAEAGRYHLYVSLACPWAHRALVYRSVLGLKGAIDISVVHPVNRENGWEFSDYPGATPDRINGSRYLHEVYARADPAYSGKVTVPVLWDRQRATIVSNESSEIIRMLDSAFRQLSPNWTDFYPEELRAEIDELNDFVYVHLNNGVYRCGFARSQVAYDHAVTGLFAALDEIDKRLMSRRYLFGDTIVETDWRLFTTLIRFDAVYYFHFKCNLAPLRSYPSIMRYLRELLDVRGVRETVSPDHIITHYYVAHRRVNPAGIIPIGAWGPFEDLDFSVAALREAAAC